MLLGLAQGVALPACVAVVGRRVAAGYRGQACAVVAGGGLLGAAAAAGLTGEALAACVPLSTPATVTADDIVSVDEITNDRDSAVGHAASPPDARDLPLLLIDRRLPERYPSNEEMAAAINAVVRDPAAFADLPAGSPALSHDGRAIQAKPVTLRTAAESERLNRLVVENALGYALRPLHEQGWRTALRGYALLGLVAAAIVWVASRGRPSSVGGPSPWRVLFTSLNHWLYCGTRFFSTYGWAVAVAPAAQSLGDRPLTVTMASLLLAAGGGVAGGIVTDLLARRVGPRWGRAYPMGVSLWVSAGLLAATPFLPEKWMVFLFAATLAVGRGFGTPAAWAFALDTGGREAGVVFGWGSAWAAAGTLVGWVLFDPSDAILGWSDVAATGAGVFAAGGLCGLLADAGKPLRPA